MHTRRTSKLKWNIEAKEHSLCAHINPGTPDSLAIASALSPENASIVEHCDAVANFLSTA